MRFLHGCDAFGRADQPDELDLLHTPALEHVRGRGGGAAGGQHGVKDQTDGDGRFKRKLVVILHGAQRLLITVQTDVPDFCAGHQSPDAFDHAQPGPQDGDEPDLLLEFDAGHFGERGFQFARR